jgi:NAD(P)-dependent dehydrogenase (short-subunit alcohol dehydrogenase family)
MGEPRDVDMKGKTCVVTGANAGIGRETVRALARMGASVGLVCRNRAKGEEALAAIRAETGSEALRLFVADLSSQAEVRRVAAELREAYPRLDVLVNNAGAIHSTRTTTADGLETTFATNHLGYFLLTHELLDVLRRSAPARVVNVASDAHRFVSGMDFDDLQSEKGYEAMDAYAQSKLANILFSAELARRLQGSGVTSNALHPGVVATNFGKNTTGLFAFFVKLGQPFMRSSEKGAATSVYLATSPEVEGVSGKYFANCKEKRPSAAARDEAAQRRLWEISERLVGLAPAA